MWWPVDSLKILTQSLILTGASIMLLTIFYTRNFFKNKHIRKKYNLRWKLMLALMVIFLVGYVAAFFVAYYDHSRIFSVLTAAVFILGSVFVYLAVRTSYLAINDLGRYIGEMETSLLARQELEQVLESNRKKLLVQNNTLLYLTKNIVESGSEEQSLQLLTEKAVEILDVERVGIWLFDKERTYISCANLYEQQQRKHSCGQRLYKKDYPNYFEALEQDGIIDAANALADPRTKEYTQSYLKPLGIVSMMDVPIHIEGKLRGVLCCEMTGQSRTWTAEEQSFAAALSDIIAVTMETFRRKRVTERLVLSESTFRAAFESSGIGMALVSPEGKWMRVNRELCAIVGYTEQELLTKTFQEITHPGDLEADLKFVEETLAGERDAYEMEKRYFHKNGTIIWIDLTVSLVRDKDGHPLFFVSQIEDITEQKKISRDLELSLSLTKATIESTADGLLVVNKDSKVTYYNQNFLRLWNMPATVLESQNRAKLLEFIKQQVLYPDQFEERAKEIYAHPEEESKDVINFVDGRVFERYSKPQIANNEIVGRVWSFRDVTLQKHAEEEIRQLNSDLEDRVTQRTQEINKLNEDLKANVQNLELANKDLESFSYSVSHDLRAPLRSIKSFVSLVQTRNKSMDEESQKFLSIVAANAKKMDQLIEDLLAFSRLGKKDLTKADIDMNELLHGVLAGINIHEWNKETKLLIGSLLPSTGDKNLLAQVFFNLVANAVKYSRPKETPVIEIGSYNNGVENVYFVKDNGVGFNMKYYDKLFKVFQRMHTTEQFEGVGVGLAIVERIVMKHGGKVWAEAEVDKGATFYFTLPVNVAKSFPSTTPIAA